MGGAKILIYRYLDDDEDTDLTAEIEIPRMGEIICRKEKTWKELACMPAPGAGAGFQSPLLAKVEPHLINGLRRKH